MRAKIGNRKGRIKRIARVHHDERGDSQVPTSIIMLAIGALILVVLLAFGKLLICSVKMGYNAVVGKTMSVDVSTCGGKPKETID